MKDRKELCELNGQEQKERRDLWGAWMALIDLQSEGESDAIRRHIALASFHAREAFFGKYAGSIDDLPKAKALG